MELKLEDLMIDCDVCQGTGKVRNPKVGKVPNQIGPETVECEKCKGKGVLLTESGKTLLRFIQQAKAKSLPY